MNDRSTLVVNVRRDATIINLAIAEGRYVYIGRGRGSKWGNPFPVPSRNYDRAADPERILERYEARVRSRPDLMAALPSLRGKVLGCWCAPLRCHGEVLVRLANEVRA